MCGSQATEPIRANDADLREVAAGLAGGLARVVVGFFNSVVDGGSFDAHVFTVESLEDFRCRDGRMNFFRIAVALLVPAVFLAGHAVARDDGRYANSPFKPWFDSLKSGKGHSMLLRGRRLGRRRCRLGIEGRPLPRTALGPMDRRPRRCCDH